MINIKTFLKFLLSTFPTLFCRCNINYLRKNCCWIEKLKNIYFKISKIYSSYSISTFLSQYSKSIKMEVKANPDLFNSLKNEWLEYFDSSSDKLKYFMVYLFYECEIFDGEVVSHILEFANQTTSLTYRYWISMHISKMVFFKQNGFYSSYYHDRGLSLKKIANEVGNNHKISTKNESMHIVIITYLLDDNIKNSMQRVAVMFANNLKNENNKITVLCLDSLYQSPKEKSYLIEFMHYDSSTSKSSKIDDLFLDSIDIVYAQGNDYLSRMSDALNVLYCLSPNIIIDIADEYSPLSYHYCNDFFTVCVPMRGAATSQLYSAILGMPFKYEYTNKTFNNCIDMSKVIEWSFPEYIPPEQGAFTKKDIGLSDDQFCIISIGNNTYYGQEFIDAICYIVKNNDKFVWLFVGNDAPDYLHQKYANLVVDKKIIEWGYEENLSGICRACDVLLRYDMTGGSGATAIAAMQGLPIVMTNFICDASRWLGLDYSSIDNYRELAKEIEKLYNDRSYYNERRKTVLDLVGNAVDSAEKWNRLAKLLTEAYERWRIEAHV